MEGYNPSLDRYDQERCCTTKPGCVATKITKSVRNEEFVLSKILEIIFVLLECESDKTSRLWVAKVLLHF